MPKISANIKPNMNANGVILTVDGIASLKRELDELKNVKLAEVVGRVAKAREDGDLSENSAYQFGKQEQEFLEGRIEQLEEILKNAKPLKVSNGKKDTVDVGCRVTVSINGKKITFEVVGDWEAKPAEKKISGNSPLGKALLGRKIGEKVEVDAPAGKIIYLISNIE